MSNKKCFHSAQCFLILIFLLFLRLRGELSNVKKEKELIIKERDEVKLNLNKSNKNSNDEITSLRMKLEEANLKLQVSQLKIDGMLFFSSLSLSVSLHFLIFRT